MNFKPILVSSTANINNHLIPGNFIVNKEDKTISVVLQDNSLLNVGKIDDAETTYAKKTDLDSVAVDVSQEQGNKLIEKPDGLFVSAVTPDELTTSLAEYVRKDETGGLGGITAEYIADSKTLRLTGIKF